MIATLSEDSITGMYPAQPNQSLIDGLACLQALASSRKAIGSREMARGLGLEVTRVNRLLKTLAYLGLAEQDERRAYRPGPAIHVLAAQSLLGSALLGRAMGPLEELHSYGHLVALGVLWRTQTCYLYHAVPSEAGVRGLGHERLYPASSSGIGMALLAQHTDEEVREIFTHADASFPEDVNGDTRLDGEEGVIPRLRQIREQGWSLVDIPDTPSYRTLAIALEGSSHAAIGFSGGFADDEIKGLLAALRRAAAEIASSE